MLKVKLYIMPYKMKGTIISDSVLRIIVLEEI